MFSQKENDQNILLIGKYTQHVLQKYSFTIFCWAVSEELVVQTRKKNKQKKTTTNKKNKKRKQDRLTIVTDGLTDRLTDRSKTYIVDFFKFFFSRNTEQIPSFGKGLEFVLEWRTTPLSKQILGWKKKPQCRHNFDEQSTYPESFNEENSSQFKMTEKFCHCARGDKKYWKYNDAFF